MSAWADFKRPEMVKVFSDLRQKAQIRERSQKNYFVQQKYFFYISLKSRAGLNPTNRYGHYQCTTSGQLYLSIQQQKMIRPTQVIIVFLILFIF